MSWASRREGVKFILGCGDSMANAIDSGALPNFRAIISKGGEFANSRREPGSTTWHGEQCCCAKRFPLSASAAIALCAASAAASSMTSLVKLMEVGYLVAFLGVCLSQL